MNEGVFKHKRGAVPILINQHQIFRSKLTAQQIVKDVAFLVAENHNYIMSISLKERNWKSIQGVTKDS